MLIHNYHAKTATQKLSKNGLKISKRLLNQRKRAAVDINCRPQLFGINKVKSAT